MTAAQRRHWRLDDYALCGTLTEDGPYATAPREISCARCRRVLARVTDAGRRALTGGAGPVDPHEPLTVGVIGRRLVISVGESTLAFAVETAGPLAELDTPPRIVDPHAFALEVVAALRREEEDGTTEVHKMLDKAAWDVWENGGDGFDYPEARR